MMDGVDKGPARDKVPPQKGIVPPPPPPPKSQDNDQDEMIKMNVPPLVLTKLLCLFSLCNDDTLNNLSPGEKIENIQIHRQIVNIRDVLNTCTVYME